MIPTKFCFIMPDIMSGLVIICSWADFCSDFWLNTPVSCMLRTGLVDRMQQKQMREWLVHSRKWILWTVDCCSDRYGDGAAE
jgi:hypothetical protein